uniref:FLYWCH-type domain-containing protein n=1 Tax=Heterorhabditis bacteriophora TaxID=37862 RepID=A0A1I7XTZ5_HETBA
MAENEFHTRTDEVRRSDWIKVKPQATSINQGCIKRKMVTVWWSTGGTMRLKLLGSWRNHHCREVIPGKRQNVVRTATFTSSIGQSK